MLGKSWRAMRRIGETTVAGFSGGSPRGGHHAVEVLIAGRSYLGVFGQLGAIGVKGPVLLNRQPGRSDAEMAIADDGGFVRRMASDGTWQPSSSSTTV